MSAEARLGLDTDVLLRWVVSGMDGPTQDDLASAALTGHPVFVNLVVLVETLWLARSTLRMGRAEQAAIVRGLLDHPDVLVADRQIVETALTAYESGSAGFADHLIGALNRHAGCATTLTFDKIASRTADFSLVE